MPLCTLVLVLEAVSARPGSTPLTWDKNETVNSYISSCAPEPY
jgi:hypothetical protein